MSSSLRLIIASVVLSVGIVAVSFQDRISWSYRKTAFEREKERRKKIDEELVFSKDPGDAMSLYGALIRLSLQPSAEVKKRVFELVRSPEVKIRAGAAFFLTGQSDTDSLAALKLLMKDPESMVRTHIARGFNHHPSPERVPVIREFLAGSVLDDQDRVHAFAALYRSVTSSDQKQIALQSIIEFGKQDKNSLLAQWALLELCNLAPQDEKVIELLRKAVQKRMKTVSPVAIRTLAVRRDAWLVENLEKLVFDTDSEIRRAAVDSILFACPLSRWTLLEKGFNEAKDLREKKEIWLAQAERMAGPEAEGFYQKLLDALKNKNPVDFAEVRASQLRMKESRIKDPCVRAK